MRCTILEISFSQTYLAIITSGDPIPTVTRTTKAKETSSSKHNQCIYGLDYNKLQLLMYNTQDTARS